MNAGTPSVTISRFSLRCSSESVGSLSVFNFSLTIFAFESVNSVLAFEFLTCAAALLVWLYAVTPAPKALSTRVDAPPGVDAGCFAANIGFNPAFSCLPLRADKRY
eukprot:TRINITY_DN1047_c0_g1_i1.p1 TRINITY_DN1047_c0_g1~~TRINITY_DN1047_c0_g1_i1.p1  ORF type:complete len:106 (-),score=4.21 TRINITY_DN1047_c0_g1_i1:46-363(-)